MKGITVLAILAAVALAALDIAYQPAVEPDAVYPMANQRISWDYAGK